MENYKKIEEEMYITKNYMELADEKILWNSIKENINLLNWATTVTKDKYGKKDILKGTAICDDILLDYEHVNEEIYKKLINQIYTNKDIARLYLNNYANNGISYLMLSLINPNLKLTKKQKAFAVREAMNQKGTIKYNNTLCKNKGINYIISSFVSDDTHGRGAFDIRYYILRNLNWTNKEKKKLVKDFWYDDNEYDNSLEKWEWSIINDEANYKGNPVPQLEKDLLYDYTYNELLNFYNDKKTTNRIWKEITFCRNMHKLRPQQWEKIKPKKLVINRK